MAILQMHRISVCALKKNRKAILERLQEFGVMEIDIAVDDESLFEKQDVAGARALFEKQTQTADQALEILQRYAPEKSGLFASLAGKTQVEKAEFEKAAIKRDSYIETAKTIVSLDKRIAEGKANIQKLENRIEALIPWMGLKVPVSFSGTAHTACFIGAVAGSFSLEDVYALIAQNAPEAEAVDAEIVSADKDYTYIAVTCLKNEADSVEAALRAGGFSRPSQSINKIPSELAEELKAEVEREKEGINSLKEEIKSYAARREELRLVSDYYRIRADKYEILGQIPQTEKTFALSGYVPAERSDELIEELSGKYDAAAWIEEIQEDEEVPVALKNNKFASCAEGILASFGLPGKGDMDPTFIMSIFYVFFFGLMLSDAAYGVIVSVICGIVLVKFPNMVESLKRSVQLFFWCGISTIVWGILLGGYFGDVVTVIADVFFGVEVTIPALWFVPLDEPMRMLMFSLLFGVIHLLTGLGIKGYMCIKAKSYVEFVCDVLFWFMLVVGLIFILLPTELFAGIAGGQIVLPAFVDPLAKALSIIGAVGILVMSGRRKKNKIALRLALGAYDLYNITGWLSDVLSYSRLLALGLATGVIASVINQMGSMGGRTVLGVIVFILVFLIGHVFNLLINLLGAYVHTSRLQYVEFFGKFYEGGGREFKPFNLKTKHVDLKEEKKLC